jgi:hypothetical protein
VPARTGALRHRAATFAGLKARVCAATGARGAKVAGENCRGSPSEKDGNSGTDAAPTVRPSIEPTQRSAAESTSSRDGGASARSVEAQSRGVLASLAEDLPELIHSAAPQQESGAVSKRGFDLRAANLRSESNMFRLLTSISAGELVKRQLPVFLAAFVIAELFYKFHSFTLECVAFLVTWFVLDGVVQLLAGPHSPERFQR